MVRSKLGVLLKSRGHYYKWVAERTGATRSQISNWCNNDESGKAISTPSVLYILRLQKLLNVNVEDMFEEIESESERD